MSIQQQQEINYLRERVGKLEDQVIMLMQRVSELIKPEEAPVGQPPLRRANGQTHRR